MARGVRFLLISFFSTVVATLYVVCWSYLFIIQITPLQAANKQATTKKKAPPPPKEVEEESSEEESSDEEEEVWNF